MTTTVRVLLQIIAHFALAIGFSLLWANLG